MQGEQRQTHVGEEVKKREEYEVTRMGGYELIFPTKDEKSNKKYGNLISKARKILDFKKERHERKTSKLSNSELSKPKPK